MLNLAQFSAGLPPNASSHSHLADVASGPRHADSISTSSPQEQLSVGFDQKQLNALETQTVAFHQLADETPVIELNLIGLGHLFQSPSTEPGDSGGAVAQNSELLRSDFQFVADSEGLKTAGRDEGMVFVATQTPDEMAVSLGVKADFSLSGQAQAHAQPPLNQNEDFSPLAVNPDGKQAQKGKQGIGIKDSTPPDQGFPRMKVNPDGKKVRAGKQGIEIKDSTPPEQGFPRMKVNPDGKKVRAGKQGIEIKETSTPEHGFPRLKVDPDGKRGKADSGVKTGINIRSNDLPSDGRLPVPPDGKPFGAKGRKTGVQFKPADRPAVPASGAPGQAELAKHLEPISTSKESIQASTDDLRDQAVGSADNYDRGSATLDHQTTQSESREIEDPAIAEIARAFENTVSDGTGTQPQVPDPFDLTLESTQRPIDQDTFTYSQQDSTGSVRSFSAMDSTGAPFSQVADRTPFSGFAATNSLRNSISVEFPQLVESVSQTAWEAVQDIQVGDSRTVRIQIHPEELGHLDIHLELTNEALKAQIVASEQVASEVLTREKPTLLHALQELGIETTELDISHRDSFEQSEDSRLLRDREGRPEPGQVRGQAPVATEQSDRGSRPTTSANSTIDFVA